MEFVVNSNTILFIAAIITAIGGIYSSIRRGVKFIDHNTEQDKKLKSIQETQTILLYGVSACLKGMKEQGCDGPVDEALKRLEKYLIETAHSD